MKPTLEIISGNNLSVLQKLNDACIDLIYIDPPFNTGKNQRLNSLRTLEASKTSKNPSDRVGFQGKKYATKVVSSREYQDSFQDFEGFIKPRMNEAFRLLKDDGSLFFHIDHREAHYCKIFLDEIFGRQCFMNEIIWSYDYGARSKKKWSNKHDSIFWYAKDPSNYCFNFEAIDRIPYMAPGLVTKEKAKLGKTPTDVWWQTIVPTNGKERTGYPTQKPLAILERIIKVHSDQGDRVLDFFAGSGTTGDAALRHGRHCTLVDQNPQSIAVMQERFNRLADEWTFDVKHSVDTDS